MTDINAVISKYKGYKCFQMKRSGFDMQYVYPPNKYPWDNYRDKEQRKAECIEIDLLQIDNNRLDGQGLPEFQHDARLYMALFEEMKGILYNVLQPDDTEQWACSAKSRENPMVFADTIGTAICLAYCKLHGLEYKE